MILTARFLYNMTSDGFFWVPGMKINGNDSNATDLDIVACCDGKLIAVECKSLEKISGNSEIWDKIYLQLDLPINTAKECDFDIFIVSIFTEKIPAKFKKQVKLLVGDKMKVEFLSKSDLENGYRNVQHADGYEYRLWMVDLINPGWRKCNFNNEQISKNPRTIYM